MAYSKKFDFYKLPTKLEFNIQTIWKMGKLYKWSKEETLKVCFNQIEQAYDRFDRMIEYPYIIDMGDFWYEVEKD